MEEVKTEVAAPAGETGAEKTVESEVAPVTPPTDNTDKKETGGDPPIPPKAAEQPSVDEEPPVRKTKLEYILERKDRKLQKLKEQAAPEAKAVEENNAEADDDLTPEEEAKIARVIEKRYGDKLKVVDTIASSTEEDHLKQEVSELIGKEPQFKEFESKILKWAKHPSRANMPLKAIAYEVAGERLMELGAQREREARKEAEASKTGGATARKPEGSTKSSAWELSKEEFDKKTSSILSAR